MSENRKIVKGAGLVGGLTLISRLFGLARDMVIASFFGATMAADAFFVAFRIPNVLRRLFAEGGLTVSFIPIFKEYEVKGDRASAKVVCDVVFTFFSLLLVIVVVLAVIFAPFIVKGIAPGFDSLEKYNLTVYLTRLVFPYLFFICVWALYMGILNSVGHFSAPAASPILLNLSIIAMAVIVGPLLETPVVSLALGVIVGGILQVALQIPYLKRAGYLPSINFNFSHHALKRLLRLMVFALFGTTVYQINIFISTILASLLPEGSVSYLYYADRFFQLPLGIFVISLATAVLPTMSEQVASGRLDDMRHSLSFSLRIILFITLPAAAGLVALDIPIVSLFFQRGEFDYLSTVKTADALRYYAIGLWAIGAMKIITPAFYSMKDMKTPVWAAFAALIANIILSVVLMGPLLHGGLALATSLSALLNLAILLVVISSKVGKVIDRSVIISFFKSLMASISTGVAAYYISTFADWKISGVNSGKIVVVTSSMLAGVVVYLFSSFLLKSEEVGYILRVLKGRKKTANGNIQI